MGNDDLGASFENPEWVDAMLRRSSPYGVDATVEPGQVTQSVGTQSVAGTVLDAPQRVVLGGAPWLLGQDD